jgi:SAM-dependent methyltransferase
MDYYSQHYEEYIESTIHADLSEEYRMVESYLSKGDRVLDVGFGSARDMLYFSSKGYEVEGIDIEEGFIQHARNLGLSVSHGDAITYSSKEKYNLVWCNACLLHLKREEIKKALLNLYSNLKEGGILFLSFKFSSKEDGYDSMGRYFTYLNQGDLDNFPLRMDRYWFKEDPTRKEFLWVDIVVKK